MSNTAPSLAARAANIKLLALDVDGVLTDGTLLYSADGGESKCFTTQDGLGIKLLIDHGIEVAIITGRRSAMVERRAKELGIHHLVQGRDDKLAALRELCQTRDIALSACAYCGDDLPDLSAIAAAGLGVSVPNAPAYVRDRADYVTEHPGGKGAVRELSELLLNAQGRWGEIVEGFLTTEATTR
ncbi:KdsC family phosphatase [Carnimonas nigrificans]|uniref:KdsC family phosphatase n=1 Tax=Carnimonas nigrificans TaxID=64323 RepID=UPI000472E6A6|nr:HAD hydrolase family protein [Carnimonas nigrificans]